MERVLPPEMATELGDARSTLADFDAVVRLHRPGIFRFLAEATAVIGAYQAPPPPAVQDLLNFLRSL